MVRLRQRTQPAGSLARRLRDGLPAPRYALALGVLLALPAGARSLLTAAAFPSADPSIAAQASRNPSADPPGPFLIAFPVDDAVEAINWPDGTRVHLAIEDMASAASPDYEADGVLIVMTGDPRAHLTFQFASVYDMKPGDIVTVTDGLTSVRHIVRNLSIVGGDAATDTVTGQSDPGAVVQVWPHEGMTTVQATADQVGSWTADFSGVFDLDTRTAGRAQILDDAGNATAADWMVPTVFSDGTLVLTTDTRLTKEHHGDIVIDADGVTLDCDNHAVLGAGHHAGIFVQQRSHVTIRNCPVLGFRNGILVDQSSRIVLEANHSRENDWGFWISASDHVQVLGSMASGNLNDGFRLGGVSDSHLSENVAGSNGEHGFNLDGSHRNHLVGNTAEDNNTYGFMLLGSNSNVLEDNHAQHNESGFVVEDSWDESLEGNVALDNRYVGFRLTALYQSRLSGNTATRNEVDGFRFDGSSGVQFIDNLAQENGQFELSVKASSDVEVENAPPFGRRGLRPGVIAAELLTFLGLASAVWLGLFLVGQPPRRPTAWLTALTLWSLAGVFFHDFMTFNEPAVGFLEQLQELFSFWPGTNEIIARFLFLVWIDVLAVVLWYHATCLMRPGGLTRARRWLLIGGYALAALAAIIRIARPEWLVTPTTAFSLVAVPSGLLNSFFAACLIVFTALSVVNLVEAARAARAEILRRQFTLLCAATVLAGWIAPIFLLAAGLRLPLPRWIGMAILWLAVILLGYGVSRYSAAVEGRTIRRQFSYSLVAVSLITLLYFVASYVSSVSFGVRTAAFAFVILLAVVTHSLIGNARSFLDLFFFDPDTRRLRQVFQDLTVEIGSAGRLHENLGLALDALCTQVRATFGFVLLFSDRKVETVAVFRWSRSTEWALRPDQLAADDVRTLEPEAFPPPLEAAALLSPLYLDTEQIGALLLGQPINGTRYPPDEVDLVGYAGDRMVRLIRADRRRQKAVSEMTRLPEPAPAPIASDGEPSIETVETSLRRMHDYAYLGSTPLGRLRAVDARLQPAAATHVDRGRAVHQVLVETIDKLKPEGKKPTLTSPREWHPYLILHEAYIADRPNRDVLAELYISEGTFNRRRREAIEAVTRMLREQEQLPVPAVHSPAPGS